MKRIISIFLLLILIASSQTINSYYSTVQSGDGTYYGTTTGGNCAIYNNGWPAFLSGQNIINVAINNQQYADSLPCGMCLKLFGNGTGSGANPINGQYIAYVTDRCPECVSPALDLALAGDGRWQIQWYAIDCPVGSYPIQYTFQGSNAYYLKIQPRGSRSPVITFEANVNGNWVAGSRTQDNFFVLQGAQYTFPLSVRLTNIFGEQKIDSISAINNNSPVNGANNIQFSPNTVNPPSISSTPSSPSPSPSSPTPSPSSPSPSPSSPTPSPSSPSSPSPSPSSTGYTFQWNSGSNAWWLGLGIAQSPPLSSVSFDCGYGKYPATSVQNWGISTYILSGTGQSCSSTKYVLVYIGSDSYGIYRP